MTNVPVYIEFFTKMSSSIFTLLLGKILFDETNSLWSFASAYGGEFVIVTLIQIYAGSVSDKYSPIRILILINTFSVITFIILTLTYNYVLSYGLLAAALAVYVFRPFYRTSLFVLVRRLAKIEDLKVLNGRVTSASQLGQIFGLTVTGLMLSFYSVTYIFLSMAIIYMICLFMTIRLSISSDKLSNYKIESDREHASWRDFAKFLKLEKYFTVRLISSFSIAFCLGGFYVNLAPLVVEKFSNNEMWLSVLSVSYASGAIFSGLIIKQITNRISKLSSDYFLLFNQIVSMSSFLSFGLLNDLGWIPLLLFVFGTSTTLAAVSLSTYLQQNTLNEFVGRTAAVQNITIALGNAFAAFYSSYLFDISFLYSSLGLSIMLILQVIFFKFLFFVYPEK
ncbi:MFS transporter [Vibrio lentus]|uniref:MFS transporter n=1 Tax=Vibrio lentus TaxID=136468 RepID=UPI000C844206|nr:MFS transporter [Vibrio lentus]PMJ04519.1 hypothetical protein BCU32_03170 [Vibrio lentus]